jgi:hypothetical protein
LGWVVCVCGGGGTIISCLESGFVSLTLFGKDGFVTLVSSLYMSLLVRLPNYFGAPKRPFFLLVDTPPHFDPILVASVRGTTCMANGRGGVLSLLEKSISLVACQTANHVNLVEGWVNC